LRDMVEDADRIRHFVEGMTLATFVADDLARIEVPLIRAAAELALER
jgi:uncharacterized protein with HEPN domain